jgi:hypothetical protein
MLDGIAVSFSGMFLRIVNTRSKSSVRARALIAPATLILLFTVMAEKAFLLAQNAAKN